MTKRGSAIFAVLDAGPLYAAVDRADANHLASLAVLERTDLQLVIPTMVVLEAAHLVRNRIGAIAEAEFLAGLGSFDIEQPSPKDWERIGDLAARYADFPLGATDATVIALAERLDTPLLITFDQRHFRAVRPRHCEVFDLLPVLETRVG